MDLRAVVARIDERLLAVGMSSAAASKAAGLSADAIRNLKRAVATDAKRGVSLTTIAALAPVLGTSAAWLSDGAPQDAAPRTVAAPATRITSIPDLAIHAGMGGGGLLEVLTDGDGVPTDPDQVRGYWEFPDYMLRRFGDLKNVYAWEARGDSMEPTLPGGSVVFVDISQSSPPPDDLYAINYGDGLMIKRVKLIPRPGLAT
jgi:phage repressor protein C with HTH and peptisase S24 domain